MMLISAFTYGEFVLELIPTFYIICKSYKV